MKYKESDLDSLKLSHAIRCGVGLKNCKCGWSKTIKKEGIMDKPKCKLVGADGNVFNLIGIVRNCLRENGLKDKVKEFTDRVTKAESYDQVLQVMIEYVDPVSDDEEENDFQFKDEFEAEEFEDEDED